MFFFFFLPFYLFKVVLLARVDIIGTRWCMKLCIFPPLQPDINSLVVGLGDSKIVQWYLFQHLVVKNFYLKNKTTLSWVF